MLSSQMKTVKLLWLVFCCFWQKIRQFLRSKSWSTQKIVWCSAMSVNFVPLTIIPHEYNLVDKNSGSSIVHFQSSAKSFEKQYWHILFLIWNNYLSIVHRYLKRTRWTPHNHNSNDTEDIWTPFFSGKGHNLASGMACSSHCTFSVSPDPSGCLSPHYWHVLRQHGRFRRKKIKRCFHDLSSHTNSWHCSKRDDLEITEKQRVETGSSLHHDLCRMWQCVLRDRDTSTNILFYCSGVSMHLMLAKRYYMESS